LEAVLSVKELISLKLSVYRESGVSVSRVFCYAKQLYEKRVTEKLGKVGELFNPDKKDIFLSVRRYLCPL
jgi:hypothetical protein